VTYHVTGDLAACCRVLRGPSKLLCCEVVTVDPSAMTEAGTGGEAVPAMGPGTSIGKYRLDRMLGAGGMGVVWAAYDPDLERPVAIKLLRSVDSAATLRTRLLREARAMARLKHPNILTVYEVGTDRNRDYIAMELIDGSDLDHWLGSRPPRADILAALLAAGRGLAAAHDAGLIHRDFKPHNILRGRDGSVYVTDFGLARGQIEDGAEVVQAPFAVTAAAMASGSHPRGDSVLDSPLTQTGVLIGTPAYMAPEQFAGRAPDPRSDQFAFCVTAWEALTGARPFAGKNLEELRVAASAGVHGLGTTGELALPPRLRGVLVRGLAANPEARWPDMRALLREIEAGIAPPRRSRVPLIAGVSLAVVGFLGGVALYLRSHSARPGPTVPSILESPRPPVADPWLTPSSPSDPPEHPTVPDPPMVPSIPSDQPPVPTPPSPPRPPGPGRLAQPHGPRNAAVAADCASPSDAFGSAWSTERRRAVTARHKSARELILVAALLDSLRRDWIQHYEAACAMPASDTRSDRLTCLREARDEINEATQELTTEDSGLSLVAVVPLKLTVGACQRE
jgi:serine/threonine protein kinase